MLDSSSSSFCRAPPSPPLSTQLPNLLLYSGAPSISSPRMADSSAAPPGTSLPAAVPPQSGHKPGFVQPSSYLRPAHEKRSMTSRSEKQIEKDEKNALVSCSSTSQLFAAASFGAVECAHNYAVFNLKRLETDQSLHLLECHSQIPESPHELRCPTSQLSPYHLRYCLDC